MRSAGGTIVVGAPVLTVEFFETSQKRKKEEEVSVGRGRIVTKYKNVRVLSKNSPVKTGTLTTMVPPADLIYSSSSFIKK